MTREINAKLFEALTLVLCAHPCNEGGLDYSQKDFSFIDDDLSLLQVQYFGEKPDGDAEQGHYDDMMAAGGKELTDKQAYDVLLARLNNTQFITSDEPTAKQFINPTLAAELAAGAFKYSALGYVIDHDAHNNDWSLNLISTSISELEGSEEGVLAEYMYNSEDEAQADIDLLGELTNCQFDKI